MGLYRAFKNMDKKFLYLLIGILIGVLLLKLISLFENDNRKNLKIYYVSQKEVMDYEESRIGSITDNNGKQLFLGNPERAANLIEETAMNYEGKERRVVFSENKVYGRNVKSISKEVYEEVIDKLKEQGLDE